MVPLEDGVKNLYLTRKMIEEGKPISQEAGDFFFSVNLERLALIDDPTEMDRICCLLKQAAERVYGISFVQEKYRDVFLKYRWVI